MHSRFDAPRILSGSFPMSKSCNSSTTFRTSSIQFFSLFDQAGTFARTRLSSAQLNSQYQAYRSGQPRPTVRRCLRFDPMLKLDKKHLLHRFLEHMKRAIEGIGAFLMRGLRTYFANSFPPEPGTSERKPTLHVKKILVFIDCDRIVRQRGRGPMQ